MRRLRPRQFKTYKSYKRWLQAEFSRLCVYCRQPDSSARNLNFGIDHYRPKSLSKFAGLAQTYSNLYYCCGGCNSRKKDYWPTSESKGPHIINPCDYVMAKHLRFNVATHSVDPSSDDGRFMADKLQLNEPVTVQFRRNTLALVSVCSRELSRLALELDDLTKASKHEGIGAEDYANEKLRLHEDLAVMRSSLDDLQGLTPMAPLPTSRLGIAM